MGKVISHIFFLMLISVSYSKKAFSGPSEWELVEGSRYEMCRDAAAILNSLPKEKILTDSFPIPEQSKFSQLPKTEVKVPSRYYDLVEDYYLKKWSRRMPEDVFEKRLKTFMARLREREQRSENFMWISKADLNNDGIAENILFILAERLGPKYSNENGIPKRPTGLTMVPFEKGKFLTEFDTAYYGIPVLYENKIRFFSWYYYQGTSGAEYSILDTVYSETVERFALVRVCKIRNKNI